MLNKTALLACTSILAIFGFDGAATAQEVYTPKYEVGVNYS